MTHTVVAYSSMKNKLPFNDLTPLLPIPEYEYMLCRKIVGLFTDHLEHGPRLWVPRTVLYGSCTVAVCKALFTCITHPPVGRMK